MTIRTLGAVIALLAGTATAAAETAPMKDAEIRAAVSGRRIYLQTPLGGEFPLNYRKNGRVDGDGEKLGLGRLMAPRTPGAGGSTRAGCARNGRNGTTAGRSASS
ncbi:hypothetical protein OHA_1_00827 [Pleomorphomonas sp. SM30]|nr:hypothetical protein OHA_1_00827 [Pleomorphomonas sp. SM30]